MEKRSKSRIKNSIQLLAALQHIAGTRKAFIATKSSVAQSVGLGNWNPQLEQKLETLCNENRIFLTNMGKRTGYRIEILKPLIPEEVSDLTIQLNKDDHVMGAISSIQNTNNDICKKIEQNINEIDNASDIDQIFDDFEKLTSGLVTKCKNLYEENIRLKALNDALVEREKKWISRATLYRQQINK